MTYEKFEEIVLEFFDRRCLKLMVAKNKEYARGPDKLHNFKKAGGARRKSPEEALTGMHLKHKISIDDMVQDLEKRFQAEGPDFKISRKDLERWEEKIGDDINYDLLLLALLHERLEKGGSTHDKPESKDHCSSCLNHSNGPEPRDTVDPSRVVQTPDQLRYASFGSGGSHID